jgi:hypothetical protein
MLLVNNVITALCIKALLVLLLVDVHCLLANKWLAKAGALLTLRRLNSISELFLCRVNSVNKKDCLGSLFYWVQQKLLTKRKY